MKSTNQIVRLKHKTNHLSPLWVSISCRHLNFWWDMKEMLLLFFLHLSLPLSSLRSVLLVSCFFVFIRRECLNKIWWTSLAFHSFHFGLFLSIESMQTHRISLYIYSHTFMCVYVQIAPCGSLFIEFFVLFFISFFLPCRYMFTTANAIHSQEHSSQHTRLHTNTITLKLPTYMHTNTHTRIASS